MSLPPRLPRLIYLNGPPGSGCKTVANHLATLDSGIAIYHHFQPIWEMNDALNLRLRPGAEPLDFLSEDVQREVVGSRDTCTWRDFNLLMEGFLERHVDDYILGTFAATSAKEMLYGVVETVIFPDVEKVFDMFEIQRIAPVRDQLLIRLERDGCEWSGEGDYIFSGVPSITIRNNTTIEDLNATVVAYLTK